LAPFIASNTANDNKDTSSAKYNMVTPAQPHSPDGATIAPTHLIRQFVDFGQHNGMKTVTLLIYSEKLL